MDKIIEILAHKWYIDCLVYNIPVSPSDVRDIVEDLLTIKKEFEEVNEMKKYKLKDYKEFCDKALVCPPIDEFEEGTIDEEEWYNQHNIKISAGNNEINIGYGADEVNEIEFALREIYEAVEGSGEATTGNTFGSQYRPAKMIDFIKIYVAGELHKGKKKFQEIICDATIGFNINTFEEVRQYVKENYKACCEVWDCDFSKFDIIHELDFSNIEKLIEDTLCSEVELSYDAAADRTYIVDFSFRQSGELVGFTWGNNPNDIEAVIHQYKADTFGWIE